MTAFAVCRLYAGRKCLGHVVDVFETTGRKKAWWRLRTAKGLAIFETRNDAIRAAHDLGLPGKCLPFRGERSPKIARFWRSYQSCDDASDRFHTLFGR